MLRRPTLSQNPLKVETEKPIVSIFSEKRECRFRVLVERATMSDAETAVVGA
jgi:hypothetical protein